MKKRVVVALEGGLGNQMFQYAAGRALSLRDRKSLDLDPSLLEAPGAATPRSYALDAFDLPISIAPPECRAAFAWRASRSFADRIYQRLSRFLSPKHILDERERPLPPPLPSLRGDLYLRGYWQDERYFLPYADQIRLDFRFQHEFPARSSQIARQISSRSTGFIHVRRGDYITHPLHARWHGACPAEYYLDAAEVVRRRNGTDTFAIFSDDPAWARSALGHLPGAFFVDENNSEATPSDHLHLMTLCQHAIISNSSFSWWAAWLIPHPEKTVVAPQRWFLDEQANHAASGIVPCTWIRL